MKTDPRCIPCFFHQCLRAAQFVSKDPLWIKTALQEVSAYLADAPLEMNPSLVGTEVHRVLRKALGHPDPFKKVKGRDNARATLMLGLMRERIKDAADPLFEAMRIAVAGNVLDFGTEKEPDPEIHVAQALKKPFPKKEYQEFLDALKKISNILILADNAGEIVFDRLLVEILKEKGYGVMVAVKEGPVINDATIEDAYAAGLHQIAGIITTGCDSVGVDFRRSSQQFTRRFNSAELILAKGQGHYETLQGHPGPVWHLFVTKCDVVAADLGVEVGEVLFFRGSSR